MKRKLISVSLALALGLSLAACGSKDNNTPPGNWVPFQALWNSSSGTPSPIRTT